MLCCLVNVFSQRLVFAADVASDEWTSWNTMLAARVHLSASRRAVCLCVEVEGWEDGQRQSSAHQTPAVTDGADVHLNFWLNFSNKAAERDEDRIRAYQELREVVPCSAMCINTQLLASVGFEVVRG